MKYPLRRRVDPKTGEKFKVYRNFEIKKSQTSGFRYEVKLTKTRTILGHTLEEMKDRVDGRIKECEELKARYEARKQGCK